MRLLIVNYEYPPIGGGAASASWHLAYALARQGHQVNVLTSAFRESRGSRLEDGVTVFRIPALRRKRDRAGFGQMACFVASGLLFAPFIARSRRIDAVIAFFSIPSGLVAYWLRILRRIPYLVSLRGGDVPGLVPEIHRTHDSVAWIRRRVLHSARSLVANSKGLADLSRATDPFPVEVVLNGVDSDIFRPSTQRDRTDSETPFRILFAGRLQEQKNVGLLLAEVARVEGELSGPGAFELHVAGAGPLEPSLRRQARRLGLSKRTFWHGWLARSELLALYQRADCLVNPSLYEGLPNTVLEAMACGLPVVASHVPGHDELVLDGRTGRLFSLKTPGHLGLAILSLRRDRKAARRLGVAGRRRAKEEFSWDVAAGFYLRLLGCSENDHRPP